MKLHIRTTGLNDLGSPGGAVAINQEIDLPTSDHPSIEITLDNGAVLTLYHIRDDGFALRTDAWSGDIFVQPEGGNVIRIIAPAQA